MQQRLLHVLRKAKNGHRTMLSPMMKSVYARQELLQSSASTKKVSQTEFQAALLNMMLHDMVPMATVECSGFQKFCARILPSITVPRCTVTRQVNDAYITCKKEMTDELQNVSCTADLWSSHNRSFIGMTVQCALHSATEFTACITYTDMQAIRGLTYGRNDCEDCHSCAQGVPNRKQSY